MLPFLDISPPQSVIIDHSLMSIYICDQHDHPLCSSNCHMMYVTKLTTFCLLFYHIFLVIIYLASINKQPATVPTYSSL